MSVNIYDSQNDELNQIAGREDTSYWEGTQAQWNALSSADKALWTGKYVIITDDAEDASTLTVTFTSNDVANTDTTKTDSGWTDTSILTSGEHLSTIFGKVSNMFKNIRRLWNTVGTTTIPSSLGGTLTDAVTALNSNYANIYPRPTSYKYSEMTPQENSGFTFTIGALKVTMTYYESGVEKTFTITKIYGTLKKDTTSPNVTTTNTRIGILSDTSCVPSETYNMPLVVYDANTARAYIGLELNIYGQLIISTQDTAFLSAINAGHIFNLINM